MFDTGTLAASVVWGAIGTGYFVYGKRQTSWPAMVGGVLIIAASYFVSSPLLMSVVCLGLMAGVYWLFKQGL